MFNEVYFGSIQQHIGTQSKDHEEMMNKPLHLFYFGHDLPHLFSHPFTIHLNNHPFANGKTVRVG